MTYSATFSVRGKPEPKGSTRAFVPPGWTRAVITSANPKAKVFAELVRWAAQEFAPPTLLTGPVSVSMVFGIQRPKSAPKKRAHPLSRVHPIAKPDVDKLARLVLDACTGVLWCDDSRVVQLAARKEYGEPGVTVTVREIY